MAKYTNNHDVPLSLAVWLATDTYDHNPDPFTVSATGLLKPTKQIILSSRVPVVESPVDVLSQLASRLGTAIHDSIENAWLNNHKEALKDLGYPPGLIRCIRVNPSAADLAQYKAANEEVIPVYLETRTEKKLGKWTISGEFDFTAEGEVEDFKSTGTYTYIKKTNDDKYIMQGSIYRWLNPDKITQDTIKINFIFMDWLAMKVKTEKGYPASRILPYRLPLKSVAETEAWMIRKLDEVERYKDSPESDIPECTAEDLWRTQTVWKYYKDPSKRARSTKNFDNVLDANTRYVNDGSVGIVVEVPGEVKACKYCDAFSVCTQKDRYIQDGTLKL